MRRDLPSPMGVVRLAPANPWKPAGPAWRVGLGALTAVLLAGGAARAQTLQASADPLTGPRSPLNKNWIGSRPVSATTEILVMAGHSDSQGIGGAGTGGAAVSLGGARPMQSGITDELYWNLATAQEVVRQGLARGLAIRFYDPIQRTIANANDPRTTWSVGKAHVAQGGYALEIHFDAYGRDGVGSGLIPPIIQQSAIDESLAAAFGSYPRLFRDGLGAPKRGIAILEIGKLEGSLEASLRNPQTREATLQAIAKRIVDAMEAGLSRPAGPTLNALGPSYTSTADRTNGFTTFVLIPPPGVESSAQ